MSPQAWRRNFSKFSSPHFRTAGWEQHSMQHWQTFPLLQHQDKLAIQPVDSQNRIKQPSDNFIFVQTNMASKPLGALAYSTGFSCSHYHHATNSTRTHTFHDLFHECNTPFQVPSRCIVIVHELSHLIFFVPTPSETISYSELAMLVGSLDPKGSKSWLAINAAATASITANPDMDRAKKAFQKPDGLKTNSLSQNGRATLAVNVCTHITCTSRDRK